MIRQNFDNFANFYPFYLSQHSNRICRRLHFIGLMLSLVVFAIVVVTASLALPANDNNFGLWICLDRTFLF
jgi:hypothetical protein